jgi:hypothetical protein
VIRDDLRGRRSAPPDRRSGSGIRARSAFALRESVVMIVAAVAILFFQLQCVVFRAGGQDETPPDVQEHRFGRVVYEMVNWENLNQENMAGEILLATIGASANFERLTPGVGAQQWFVQIILETLPGKKEMGSAVLDRPGYFLLGHLNGILFGQTFFIIPKVNYQDRDIKFAVWRAGELQREYVYQSDAWILIGWLSLLAVVPSESQYLRYDMSRVARSFVAEAARDGYLTPGGVP